MGCWGIDSIKASSACNLPTSAHAYALMLILLATGSRIPANDDENLIAVANLND